jgi:hypothetical protein
MYGPSVVLLEHYPAPEFGEGAETLDLVRVGADGNPHWTRVWPTPEDNPRHAGLDRWLCVTHSQWNACQNLLNICAQKECQAILAWLLIYVEVREHILGPVRQRSIRFAK